MFVFLSKSPHCYVFISAIIVQSGPIPDEIVPHPIPAIPQKSIQNLRWWVELHDQIVNRLHERIKV